MYALILRYTLKINNFSTLDAAVNNDWANARGSNDDKKKKTLQKRLKDKYKRDSNIERVFLKEFSAYGISIYKAADQEISNWKKLELENPNSNNSEIIETPCN